ncbi:MAG: glycosyltransferase family 2 protein [Elusimicrobiota bacterium]
MPELAVIIPAFNSEAVLPGTLARLAAVRAALPDTAVLLVNDGSADGTSAAAILAAGKLGLEFSVLTHTVNRGYGAAQKTGLRAALDLGCRAAVLLHADGQYAPEELPALVRPVLDGSADVAAGSRLLSGRARAEGMPLARYLANRWLTALENAVFGLDFPEYHSGYMAYSAGALRAIKFETLTDKFHFDGEMLLCAGKLGLRVARLPVSAHYGPESSSLSPLPYLAEVASVLLRYLRRGYFFQR